MSYIAFSLATLTYVLQRRSSQWPRWPVYERVRVHTCYGGVLEGHTYVRGSRVVLDLKGLEEQVYFDLERNVLLTRYAVSGLALSGVGSGSSAGFNELSTAELFGSILLPMGLAHRVLTGMVLSRYGVTFVPYSPVTASLGQWAGSLPQEWEQLRGAPLTMVQVSATLLSLSLTIGQGSGARGGTVQVTAMSEQDVDLVSCLGGSLCHWQIQEYVQQHGRQEGVSGRLAYRYVLPYARIDIKKGFAHIQVQGGSSRWLLERDQMGSLLGYLAHVGMCYELKQNLC